MNKFLLSILWLPCLAVIPLSVPQRTYGADAANVRLVGHSDLQGRDALQVVLKGNYAYVGHHRGREKNPMTGAVEWNGTTILDVSNPKRPRIVKHLPGYEGAESRAVQVVEKYFDGRDGEIIGGSLLYVAYFNAGLRIVDISDPFKPREVGHYIPAPAEKRGEGHGSKKLIQTNDVDLDSRGLIYVTDRVGAGLHILEFTGKVRKSDEHD